MWKHSPTKASLDPYVNALYHQEFKNFQNIQDNQPFTLYFNYDKTHTHTFQSSFLYQNVLRTYDQILHLILMETRHITDPEIEFFPHQCLIVDQFLSVLGTLGDTISNILIRFPRNDPTNQIQKKLHFLPIVFRSVLDQFSLVENPDISHLKTLSQFLQYYFKNCLIHQTLQSISKYKTIFSNYLSSLVLFHENFDFQYSRNISPIIPIFHFTELTLYTKQ